MKNVTVTMRDEVAHWARVHAAQQGKSLSRMLSDIVEERMRQEEGYQGAMERYLARERGPLKATGRYPTREDLHDRRSGGRRRGS